METETETMREAIRNRLENGYPIRPDETVIEIAIDYVECTGEAMSLRPAKLVACMKNALLAEGFDQPLGKWK